MSSSTPGPDPAQGSVPAPGSAPVQRSRTARIALWLSIGMLVAAALLGGFFIIVGDQANVAGRAWLTMLLVAVFAGTVLLDTTIADGPNRWYLAASTIVNVVLVAIGLMKVWNGWLQPANTADPGAGPPRSAASSPSSSCCGSRCCSPSSTGCTSSRGRRRRRRASPASSR